MCDKTEIGSGWGQYFHTWKSTPILCPNKQPTVSPWRSSSGFITDLSWPKYGLLSKGIVLPSYLWPRPRPLPRASTRCCVEAQQVRSGNWSSWKPREKQLSRWLSHIKWTMKPHTQVQHICTVLWKSCTWGSWGEKLMKGVLALLSVPVQHRLVEQKPYRARRACAHRCQSGPELTRSLHWSACALVHNQREHRLELDWQHQ